MQLLESFGLGPFCEVEKASLKADEDQGLSPWK